MKRELVKDAINHKITQITPFNVEMCSVLQDKVTEILGIKKEDFFSWSGNYIEKTAYNNGESYLGYFKDEFGVVWNRNGIDKEIGTIDEILIKGTDINSYVFPTANINEVAKKTLDLVENKKDTFKLGKIGFALFERAWSLTGFENMLLNLALKPKFCEELLDKVLNYNMEIIKEAVKYNLDGFYFGDDYGQQTGMLMSPNTWRKFIKPRLAKMFEPIKNSNKVVILHSCGNISEIFEDLIDIGLDVYQTFQPEVYNIKEIKQKYGNNLTFYGGISTQRLLPFATKEEVCATVKELIEVMSKNGGYIAAPTHQVPADVPPNTMIALIEFLNNQKN